MTLITELAELLGTSEDEAVAACARLYASTRRKKPVRG